MSRSETARELAAMLSGRVEGLGDPHSGWAPVLEIAAEHRLLAGLGAALRERGVPALPAGLAGGRSPLALLQERYRSNAARVDDLRRQLAAVLDALGAAAVPAIPLKGAHWLRLDVLRDPAGRETIDLDVLVPPSQATEADAALRRLGYWSGPAGADVVPSDHQLGAVFPRAGFGSVEIHLEPIVARHRALVSAAELRESATIDAVAGPLPDATTSMTLLIGHSQLQDNGARLLELPLRALHDLYQLDRTFVAAVDWDEVTRRFWRLGPGGRLALAGFAAAASTYVGVDVPVPTRGGYGWLRAAEAALDRPRRAADYRHLMYLPIALRAERMERLHGPRAGRGGGLWAARARHVAAGARRRLRRPAAKSAPPGDAAPIGTSSRPARSSREGRPQDNGVAEELDRTVAKRVVDHGTWRQIFVTLPPFHWRVPSGLDATATDWYWRQDENMRHFVDTRAPVTGVVRVVDDGIVDGFVAGRSTPTHYVNLTAEPRHTSTPTHDCAMYVAGHQVEYFQHFLDNGVPHISLMLMAADVSPAETVLVTNGWTTEAIPAIVERWGFNDVVAVAGPVSAATLILPEMVPRIHPLFYERFRRDMRFAGDDARLVVLVSRTASDTPKRTRLLANQHELEEALGSRFGSDFVVFRPRESTFREAAAVFEQATMVIGMHGGGMYNAIFSAPSTTVVELMPVRADGLYHGQGSGHETPPFAHLAMHTNAMLLGQEFHRFYVAGDEAAPVDVERFMGWLDSVPAARRAGSERRHGGGDR